MRNALSAIFLLGVATTAPGAILWFPHQNISIPTTFEVIFLKMKGVQVSSNPHK